MSDHTSEVVVGIIGVVTSATAWFLGGKQTSKNSEKETLTKGADQIVETSTKLLVTVDKMLQEEREHRSSCEKEVHDLKLRIDDLESKL